MLKEIIYTSNSKCSVKHINTLLAFQNNFLEPLSKICFGLNLYPLCLFFYNHVKSLSLNLFILQMLLYNLKVIQSKNTKWNSAPLQKLLSRPLLQSWSPFYVCIIESYSSVYLHFFPHTNGTVCFVYPSADCLFSRPFLFSLAGRSIWTLQIIRYLQSVCHNSFLLVQFC